MNVKPGDLARVVAPYTPNGRGAFVVVERDGTKDDCKRLYYDESAPYGWLCSGYVRDIEGTLLGPELLIYDECLRHVDPGEGEDQIRRIAGKPEEVTA